MFRALFLSLLIVGANNYSPLPAQAEPIYRLEKPAQEPDETDPLILEEDNLGEKSPWLAMTLSLAAPGTGQIYVAEDIWPGLAILGGMAAGVLAFILIDQARSASVREVELRGQKERLADARLESMTLILQIALPTLWIWNFTDAYHRAEEHNQKVTGNIDKTPETPIIK